MRAFFTLLWLVVLPQLLFAEARLEWTWRFDQISYLTALDITPEGGCVVAGFTPDKKDVLFQLSATGELEWRHDDAPSCSDVCALENGFLINNGRRLIRLDNEGAVFDTVLNGEFEKAQRVGKFVVATEYKHDSLQTTVNDFFDLNGNLLGSKELFSDEWVNVQDYAATSSGAVICAFQRTSSGDGILLRKQGPGAAWTGQVNLTDFVIHSSYQLCEAAHDGVLLAYTVNANDNGDSAEFTPQISLTRFDSTGDMLWTHSTDEPNQRKPVGLCRNNSGGHLLVLGHANDDTSFDIAHLGPNGKVNSENSITLPDLFRIRKVVANDDSTLFVAGDLHSTATKDFAIAVCRVGVR